MNESQLTKKIVAALRDAGVWAVKIHGGPHQSRGLPDVIACCDGQMIGLEVKLPAKRHTVTRLQAITLRDLSNHGAVTAVVTSEQEALDAVLCTD